MHISLKLATSLDGKIALNNGHSQWITNSGSRAYGHTLRAKHGAILVGIGTAVADDPLLTARSIPLPDTQPTRIIMDNKARLSPSSRLANSTHLGPVVLATGQRADAANLSLLKAQGVDVWNCGGASKGEEVDAELVIKYAQTQDITSLLIEGGGQIAASFLRAGLIDTLEWFVAPVIIGGDGIPAIAPLALDNLPNAPTWTLHKRQQFGEDTHTTYKLKD